MLRTNPNAANPAPFSMFTKLASKYVVSCQSCHTVARLLLPPWKLLKDGAFDRCPAFFFFFFFPTSFCSPGLLGTHYITSDSLTIPPRPPGGREYKLEPQRQLQCQVLRKLASRTCALDCTAVCCLPGKAHREGCWAWQEPL